MAKKIQPVITSGGSKKSENLEESKQKSSSSNSESSKSGKSSKSIKKEKKSKKNKDNKDKSNNKKNNINNSNNKKQEKLSNEEKILEDVKLNFSKEKYLKLKELLEKKDKEIIKIIKTFEKNNDYNHLLSKLSRLVDSLEENSEENLDEENVSGNENDSSYYIRKEEDESNETKSKNKKNKKNNEEMQKISKNVYNALKNKGKDLYYIAKYDMQQLKNDEKKNLFTKQFKLDMDKLNKDNYKIPKKNVSLIKKYYTDYILKKICKNYSEDEKQIYNRLLEEEDEENNIIIQYYKDLLNHQNITELRNQLKKIIKEAEERIEEEENEDDDEDNKGKNSIKEENEENEDEEDEEEEDEGEGEEEEEDEAEENEDNQDEKNSENKSKKENEKDSDKDNESSSNNKDNFILNDVNKDRAVNILNNNYKKINNFNNFSNFANINNNNNNNNNNNSEDSEEKKESFTNFQNTNNNNNKLNTTNSVAKESSQSTNNPNKKLNQFITQIEHMKKIDNIKKTIIDAIHTNNKYVMDLFEKFQKNKFNLNPKSLNAVYKQIKDNPDTQSKDYIFKSLIKEMPNLSENIQDFICDEFINKNQELETFFSVYENTKEKDEFFESIEIFLKKPNTKKNLIQFSLKKIKSEISSTLLKKGIIKILKKYNLFNEKEYNIIMNSLDNDDDVFTATFQVLFDDQDLNEFYETMNLALDNQMKKDGINGNEEKWNNDLIRKNYKEIKNKIDEKHKNENLYNILKDINSSNINEKIENAKTLILKKELSAT